MVIVPHVPVAIGTGDADTALPATADIAATIVSAAPMAPARHHVTLLINVISSSNPHWNLPHERVRVVDRGP